MSAAVRLSSGLLAISMFAPVTPVAARASASSGPTPGQIRRAVSRAERSRNLWATINICNTKRHPRALGIRGQMPSLGFWSSHELNIRVEYRPSTKIGFKPSGVTKSVALGNSANRLLQSGWMWQFPAHTGTLRGSVTFVWRRGHQLLGRVTEATTAGHHDADFADPPRFSAAQCPIP